MAVNVAHTWEEKDRTNDVAVDEDLTFEKMMLSPNILKGLKKCGYIKPSPIQCKAIPLGVCGLDLLVQAKSGTGKTLVYSIVILESYSEEIIAPQSLVLVPTREIAVQVQEVLTLIGALVPHFSVGSFIGGLDIADDRKLASRCKAIVGTPGRILHLINAGFLNVSKIKLLILDEADKLMQSPFKNDITAIHEKLSPKLQMVAASATFEYGLDKILASYMKKPIGVTPKREAPILLGVKQFVFEISEQISSNKEMLTKIDSLKNIFSSVSFKQCLIFSNSQSRAESYSNYLNSAGWPTETIMGSFDQKKRLAVLKKLKEFKCRILVSTDLMARGIDAENINLVINIDIPNDSSCYLHRIGRAGRFGSHGIAITFVCSDKEMTKFRKLLGSLGGEKMSVVKFPQEKRNNLWEMVDKDMKLSPNELIYGLVDEKLNDVKSDEGENNRKENFQDNLGKTKTGSIMLPIGKNNKTVNENLALCEITELLIDSTSNNSETSRGGDLFEDYEHKYWNSTEIQLSTDKSNFSAVSEKSIECILSAHKTNTIPTKDTNSTQIVYTQSVLLCANGGDNTIREPQNCANDDVNVIQKPSEETKLLNSTVSSEFDNTTFSIEIGQSKCSLFENVEINNQTKDTSLAAMAGSNGNEDVSSGKDDVSNIDNYDSENDEDYKPDEDSCTYNTGTSSDSDNSGYQSEEDSGAESDTEDSDDDYRDIIYHDQVKTPQQLAYHQWMHLYMTQAKQISHYVNYCSSLSRTCRHH